MHHLLKGGDEAKYTKEEGHSCFYFWVRQERYELLEYLFEVTLMHQ